MIAALPPDPPPIIGRASVIDGDTLEIHGQRIRLWGIDAPESRQTCTRGGEAYRCGQEAANRLAEQIGQSTVTCEPQGRPDRYRRIVARCWISVGAPSSNSRLDIGSAMVATGHALDYPLYSSGYYRTSQQYAQRQRLGVWEGEFQRPWEWRAR